MKNYDKAYDLAKEIKESEEYLEYCSLRDEVFADEINRSLYKQYRQLSLSINAALMAGQEIDEETNEKYNKLTGLLSLNPKVNEFMIAEHRVNQTMGDIFKILADAIELELDFLKD